MKIGRKPLMALISTALIIIMIGPSVAQSFIIPSRAEFDQTYAGTKAENAYYNMNIVTQQEAEKYPFVWWRDTTNQNNLWAHSAAQFPNRIITAYEDSDVRVLVYAGQVGSNVIAIVGPEGNTIVGCGGSRNAAKIALYAFSKAVPYFQVNLTGIILTEANPEILYGAQEWVGVNINRTHPVQVWGRSNILEVGAVKQAILTALVQQRLYAYGPELYYGPNGNLGVGSDFAYNPYQIDNGIVIPNRFASAETTVTLGGVSMKLLLTAQEDAGLAVYLPTQKLLVLGELFGKYFPPYGSIIGVTDMPPTRWITVLDNVIKLKANVLIPMHTLPITNAVDAEKALTDTKNALSSVHTQVVQKINAMQSEDDIVASVKIPEPLASQPYVQEHASSVECAIRAIYHYYVGWFNWKAESLNTLSEREQAQFIVDLAGGPQKALSVAKTYETDHTIQGVQKAIIISSALRLVAPSHDADLIYIQALRKMGYSQESGQLRNFYLLTAQRAEAAMG